MTTKNIYSINNRFILGIALNTIFIFVELFYGYKANSVALIADAVHNAADVFGLILIWFSYILSARKAPRHFTFGYKNATIFAAFANAIVIFFAVGNLFWGSATRLFHPEPVMSLTMMYVATIGVLINGLTAYIFFKDRKKDINLFGVFLNMAIDAAVSVGVVIAGACIWFNGWEWLDPAMGLIIAVAIIFSSWGFFKESINLIFQAVPSSVSFYDLEQEIKSFEQIISYHDLHVWAVSTTETSLSVHVVVKAQDFTPAIIFSLNEVFNKKFYIQHNTIQLEVANTKNTCITKC